MIYVDPQKTVDLFANALKDLEEVMYQGDKAVVLPNVPRCCQLNFYGCGASSVFSLLRFFGKRCTLKVVERDLRTDWDGTEVADIKKVLTKYGLRPEEKKRCGLTDLTKALDAGFPVLVSTHDSSHYSVVFGYSSSHIFVMNPAIIGECGSLWCRVPMKRFKQVFDRWGLIVRDA